MSMTTIAAVQEALKEFYLPGLRYQLNDKASAFLAQIEKSTGNVVGKEVVLAMRYGRVGGIGNRADDGDLPTPNGRKTKQAKWETKNNFARFRITDKTIKASRSNAGAFANLLEQEISDCETDAKLDMSRQALGDGIGTLAKVTAVDAGGTAAAQIFTVDSTMYLAEGMLVDLIDSSAAPNAVLANAAEMEIILVDDINGKVTVEPKGDIHSTAGVGDYLVVSGNYGLELTGIGAVMSSSGSLYGLSKATYPWLIPQLKPLNGEISDTVLQTMIDQCETKTGSQINYIQVALGVRRAYIDYLSANKINPVPMELKGGWKALSYNGIPVMADKYIPAGICDMLDLNDWGLYQMSDFEWLDEDGAMLSRVTNKAAWEATLARYADIACSRPRGQARITGITEH